MKKIKYFTFVLIFLILIFSGAFLWTKNSDIGIDHLDREISRILQEKLGCCFTADVIKGNPITGYYAENVNVTADGKQFIIAERIELQPELFSLLKGDIVIADLKIQKSTTDMDIFISLLKRLVTVSGPKKTLVQRISISDSLLSSKKGSVMLEKGLLITGSPHEFMDMIVDGSVNGIPVSAEGKILADKGGFEIKDLKINSYETSIALSGEINHRVFLTGTFETARAGIISDIFPHTGGTSFAGGLSSSVTVKGAWPELQVEGKMRPKELEISGFLFNEGIATWHFSKGKLEIPEARIKVFGSSVEGKMSFDLVKSGLPTELVLQGTEIEAEKWTGALPWLDFVHGIITTMKADLRGPIKELSGEISFNSENKLTFKDQDLKDCSASAHVEKGRTVDFTGEGLWNNARITGKGQIELGKVTKSDMTFTADNVDLSAFSKKYSKIESLELQGNITGKVNIQKDVKSSKVRGVFRSQKIRTREELLEEVEVDFLSSGNTTTLNRVKLKWRGNSLNITGKAEDLLSGDPEVDLVIASPSLAGFFPGNLYGNEVKGTYTDGIFNVTSFSGSYAEGTFDLAGSVNFTSPATTALTLNGAFRDINCGALSEFLDIKLPVQGSLKGELAIEGSLSEPQVELLIGSKKLVSGKAAIENIKTSIKIRDNTLFIKGFKADISGSPLKLSGKILFDPQKGNSLDLHAVIEEMPLREMFRISGLDLPVDGSLDTDIVIGGKMKKPEIFLSASSKEIYVKNTLLRNVVLKTGNSTTGEEFATYQLDLEAGGKTVIISGEILHLKEKKLLTFSSEGENIKLSELFRGVENSTEPPLDGTASYSINGEINGETIKGNATVTSPELSIGDIDLKDLSLSLGFDKTSITADNGKASFYQGDLDFSGAFDLENGKWKSSISIDGADMEMLTSDLGNIVNITGKASLDLDLSGLAGKIYLMNGNGDLNLEKGVIKGLEGLKKMSKTDRITYKNIDAVFNINGRKIYLMPGSRLSASREDPNFRYLSASGALGSEKHPMNLKCSGVLNIQALGVLLGAMKGLVSEGVNGEALLQNFLSGILGGYTGNDFREATFEVRGTWNDPELHNLDVTSFGATNFIPQDSKNGIQQDTDEIKFEVKFPTGEGEDSSSSAGNQFKKQFMDNLLNQIFEDDSGSGEGPSAAPPE
jgi:translocation and assembly module TamB